MSLWFIAWSYLWDRKLTTALTILSVGLAVALISSVLTIREEARKRFEEEGQAFDIVVGAKGSPLQLVLSSVYFMDTPTGNIPTALYEQIRADEAYVEAAYPIGLGDSFQGFRIVGTDPALFDHTWQSPFSDEIRRPFQLREGRKFEGEMEAVLGGLVAQASELQIGDSFVGSHGFVELPESFMDPAHDHSDLPYTVVGILELSNSPFDRAVFTSIESVWTAHGGDHGESSHGQGAETGSVHATDQEDPFAEPARFEEWGRSPEDMVTAVLVQLQSPALRFQYLEEIRENTNAMAAIPINEIAKLFDQFLGTAKNVLLAVGYLVVVISSISILIGLYLSILQRKRDLAIMRALGASAYEILGAVLIEALLVTLMGIVAGIVLGKATTYVVGQVLAERYGLVITAYSSTAEEYRAFAVVGLLGVLAGVLPAWQAYRSDIARDLAER